jgi:hypothetical protein
LRNRLSPEQFVDLLLQPSIRSASAAVTSCPAIP